jgi:hypothetical protein
VIQLEEDIMAEPKTQTERRDLPGPHAPPEARVREDDLEPHAGLRYIARMFKVLAVLLGLLMIAEIVLGITQNGTAALGTLLIQATQLVVFASLLWGLGDIALMLIESNHDLRATRILLGRVNNNLQQMGPNWRGSETPLRKSGD